MGRTDADTELAAELAAIPELSFAELRQRWLAVTDRSLPRVKRGLLRCALAWELQALSLGGLPKRTEQALTRAAEQAGVAPPTALKLVREWHGVLHTVMVEPDQTIRWNGQQWNSLSEVAREITGTRWSGPAFFGLKKPGVAA
jgi:hypothetical protein